MSLYANKSRLKIPQKSKKIVTLMTGGGGVIQVNFDELDLNDKEHIYRMIIVLIILVFKSSYIK